jgi:CheY-like chemotaxis protein
MTEFGELTGMCALIVDDQPQIRQIVSSLLAARGVVVSEAADGLICLEAVAVSRYDVVLLDYRMPGLTGAEVLTQIRSADGPNRETPIIAVTAEDTTLNSDLFAPFDGIVAKPLSAEVLYRTISSVVRQG